MKNIELVKQGAHEYRQAVESSDHSAPKRVGAKFPDFAEVFLAFGAAFETDDVETIKTLTDAVPELAHTPVSTAPNLNHAALLESTKCVGLLLEIGCDPNEVTKYSKSTALYTAAAKGNLEIVTLLHEAGAELETSTMSANPLIGAIHAYVPPASRDKCLDVALYLIDAGIDTTASYVTGRPMPEINALQFAVEMGARHIARAIALHQTGGDETATQALLDEADRLADLNTVPPEDD